MTDNILEMKGIKKSFGGIHALSEINFNLHRGEILALVGENGAGKSTLMKILSGVYTKDAGDIILNGNRVKIKDPNHSRSLGISIIYQELAIAGDLTVMENVFLGDMPATGGMVNWRKMGERTKEIFADFDLNIPPETLAGDLSIAHQQQVEIAKALSTNASILVLDEPSAVLSQEDVKKLFKVMRRLKESGVSIIYISHRMEELFEIADRITVVKDGTSMGDLDPTTCTKDEVIAKMIGRELKNLYPIKQESRVGKTLFEVRNISTDNRLDNISFSVGKGEIFGLAGLVGSGRSRLVRTICGLEDPDKCEMFLGGEKIRNRSLARAIKNGFGLVPENRKEQGLFVTLSILENTTVCVHRLVSRFSGILKKKFEIDLTRKSLQKFNTKYSNLHNPIDSLSGGNQQKVAIAKWDLTVPQVFIFDEPTRGVDVGAKAEIYKLIDQMAQAGKAIIIISSDLPEVIGLCDRVGVMARGKLATTLERDQLDEHTIMSAAV